jgi:mRNA-degrading endonuclease RelE of RelBE toxin-antitoxin system
MKCDIDDEYVSEFHRDLKRLRKYKHLADDLQVALKAICTNPESEYLVKRINDLGEDIKIPIYKLKKFHSTDIKNKGARSGFRLIYAYKKDENKIYLDEIFHKSQKANEDRERIYKYFREKNCT